MSDFSDWMKSAPEYKGKDSTRAVPALSAGRSERDMESPVVQGEKTLPGAPRSSLTAFQAYHRSVLLILEDAAQQLPDQYPDLVRILAKKLEREM